MSQDNPNSSPDYQAEEKPNRLPTDQKATVAALGLRKVGATVVLPANDSVRGMVFKVKHLLEVTEGEGAVGLGSGCCDSSENRFANHPEPRTQNLQERRWNF